MILFSLSFIWLCGIISYEIFVSSQFVPHNKINMRFRKTIRLAETQPIRMVHAPYNLPVLHPLNSSVQHNLQSKNVIFSFTVGFCPKDPPFLMSARKFFSGDIVIAVGDTCRKYFIQKLIDYGVIIYVIPLKRLQNDIEYVFSSLPENASLPAPILRYYIYQYWASIYNTDANILISDFRDVFFQKNPFSYKNELWLTSRASIAVALEVYPNKIIKNCNFNRPWVAKCFGSRAAGFIDRFTVSCSGVTIGTRDSILVYVRIH